LTCQTQPNRLRGRKAATSSEKQRLVPFIRVYGIKREGGAVLILSEKDKLRLVPFIRVYGIKREGGAVLIVSEKDKLRLVPFISVTGIKRREEQS
jgi:hypothetical protein